jgi:acyl-CoA synthetase (AMP-forming)/AMP-acid ligase II
MNVFDYFLDDWKGSNKQFVLGPSEQATFKKIHDDSLHLSTWLKNNLGENNRIILISPNSVFFITVYLGIMKSGNVVVPINPVIEQTNLDYISDITEATHAFLSSRIKSKYKLSNIEIFDENDLERIITNEKIIPDTNTTDFDSERMAEILFTSGSTGHPKGVMLSHKNLIANTSSIVEYLRLGSDDIMEVVLPFYYCYGLSLLHTHLKAGGAVVLNNNFIFLGSILNDLKKYRCTGFAGVPSHFQILLRKSESFKKTEFPDLKYVTQAGGKLHDVFIREFVEAFPDKKFYVMYGQTEATARLSYLPPELVLEKIGSMGKGIPGVTLEIFNSNNEPVENGEVGEVVAKGDNIMIGYLNDPEANKKTLQNGWLHTGDMARKDEDGFFYVYARKKEIIKVGGKRVSPKEIEEVIVSLPFVLSCRIKGEYDEILGEAIKAVIMLKDGMDQEEAREQILKLCRKNLALFKVPGILEFESKIIDPLKMSK